MTHDAYIKTITLEAFNDKGTPSFRAITLHNEDKDMPECFAVCDIFESSNIDTLRDMVKLHAPDLCAFRYYTETGSHDGKGGWSDALRVLKTKLFAEAEEVGAPVRRNMSALHLFETRLKYEADLEALAAKREDERLASEMRAALREESAELRKDFDTWRSNVRREDNRTDYALMIAMTHAYASRDGWAAELATHMGKLAENPTYCLGWSGGFVEKASEYEVSVTLIDHFEAGVQHADMLEMCTSNMLQNADRVTSRSTSTMSNLVDDATRSAWTTAFKRVSGRAMW